MNAIRLAMSSQARANRPAPRGIPLRSSSTRLSRCFEQLGVRDHRDDGSLLGGLIIMLLVALPFWVMAIILFAALL